MEFTINLQVDCTDRLEALLTGLLSKSSVQEQEQEATSKPKLEEQSEETKETPEVKETQAEDAAPKKEASSDEITDEQVRDAFTACKIRLLGENPDSHPLKKKIIRKAKEYLKTVGADNLVQIPQNKRKEFLELCEIMTIDTEDNPNAPF